MTSDHNPFPTNGHSRHPGAGEHRADILAFRPSAEPSLGVEVELMILDRESGDLAQGAVPILSECAKRPLERVSAELMQSMIEVKTSVCRDVNDVREDLTGTLSQVRDIARSLGFDLGLSGTHPFHRPMDSVLFPAERYERIQERLAWLTCQRVVFGLHVHVGVPSGDLALGVTSMMVQYLPHLVALSANSPFWQGVDTGLASTRTALYRMLPHAGVPRYFRKWKEFRAFCHVMQDCKAMASFRDIYWDIRPRPDLGTLEFRICDAPPSVEIVLGLVALIRSLVISCLRLLQDRPQLKRGDMRRHWIAIENKWLATRHGLTAMYIRTPAGKRRPLAKDVTEILERVTPIAQESGDDRYLAALDPKASFESGADRQRRIYRETGDWKAVIDDRTAQLAASLIEPHFNSIR